MGTPEAVLEPAKCLHCGLLVRSGDPFCCSGCEFVYRTIHSLGLTDFYKYRRSQKGTGAVPATPKHSAFSEFDTESFAARFVESDGPDVSKVSFLLTGIHCAGCVWLLERLPEIVPGVRNASVNFSTGRITIRFMPSGVALSKIARMLDSLGYSAIPDSARAQDEALRKEERALLIKIGVAAFCASNTMMLAASLFQGLYCFDGIA
jgi:P-type Cu2+ transporter